jgi:hypothetical protein
LEAKYPSVDKSEWAKVVSEWNLNWKIDKYLDEEEMKSSKVFDSDYHYDY